jgi:hypothetical protein
MLHCEVFEHFKVTDWDQITTIFMACKNAIKARSVKKSVCAASQNISLPSIPLELQGHLTLSCIVLKETKHMLGEAKFKGFCHLERE